MPFFGLQKRRCARPPSGPGIIWRVDRGVREEADRCVMFACPVLKVMVVLGAYIDGFWSPWHDMAAVWLRLAQGFLFPLVLCLTDRHHWTALKKTLQRRSASADFTGGTRRKLPSFFSTLWCTVRFVRGQMTLFRMMVLAPNSDLADEYTPRYSHHDVNMWGLVNNLLGLSAARAVKTGLLNNVSGHQFSISAECSSSWYFGRGPRTCKYLGSYRLATRPHPSPTSRRLSDGERGYEEEKVAVYRIWQVEYRWVVRSDASFLRSPGKAGDDNRYRLYPGDAKSYIKHLGPVAPIGIVTNYKRSSANYGRVSKSRPGRSSSSRASDRPRLPGLPPPKYLVPGIYNVDCVLDKAAYLRSCTVQIQHQQHLQQQHLQQQQQQQQCSDSPGHLKRPLEDAGSCCSIDSAVKVHIPAVDYESDKMRSDDDAAERRHSMALQQDLPAWIQAQEEDHIYATLSDTLSLRSTVAGESCATFSAPEEESDSDDAGSFTTDANDDFEFHDTRPCGGEVRMRPSTALDAAYATYGVVQDYSENSGGYGRIQKPADPPPYQESCNSMAGSRNASYSMNDLDLIDKMDDGNEHADDDGFRTPWRQPRSESLMSLYNPPAEQDPEVVSADDVLAREHGGVTGDPYSLGQKVMEAIMKNGRSSFVIRRNYVRKAKKRIGLKKHKLVFDCEGIDDGFTAVRRFPFQQHRLGGINAIRRIGSPTSQWHVPVGPAGRLTVISEFI
ncbi:hypothetical protein HPB48_010030 [Haemaphysalis longicornis]|uniref:Uncharacterized protein n=1 Tax=Haemaphysalis longicornis TaxID=44386 RepID=A0A9J6GT41_HAELO|nr:hypothetical protein HPB48_010030 [Haemaphysalis longicornis]